MKYLLLSYVLILMACEPKSKTDVGIIHDYVFREAQRVCEPYGGLHYIFVNKTLFKEESTAKPDFKEFPCEDVYGFRCQDQSLHKYSDGIGYCFIDQSQIQETKKQLNIKEEL